MSEGCQALVVVLGERQGWYIRQLLDGKPFPGEGKWPSLADGACTDSCLSPTTLGFWGF